MIKGLFAAQKESKNLPGIKSVNSYGGAEYALEFISIKDEARIKSSHVLCGSGSPSFLSPPKILS